MIYNLFFPFYQQNSILLKPFLPSSQPLRLLTTYQSSISREGDSAQGFTTAILQNAMGIITDHPLAMLLAKYQKKGISFLIFVWFSFFLHIQYSECMIFLHQLFIYPFKRVGIKYCWDSTILLSKTNGSAQVALTRFFWLGRKTLPLLGWDSRKCWCGWNIQYVTCERVH